MNAPPARKTHRSLRMTRRGWALAVAAVVLVCAAPLAGLPALSSIGSLAGGLVLAALMYILVAPRAWHVTRSIVPDIAECGQPAMVRVDVVNCSRWPSAEIRWRDELPAGGLVADASYSMNESARRLQGMGKGASGVIAPLRPGAAHRGEYAVIGRLRGDYQLGPLRMRAIDPFGLVRRDYMVGDNDSLIVLPHRAALEQGASGAGAVGTSRPASAHGGPGGDDVIARPYVPGDPLRRVHWKATAHRGEPMVRQEEQDDSRHALVLLDPSVNPNVSPGAQRSGRSVDAVLEWAVSMTASLVEHLAEQGFTVTMHVLGTSIEATVGYAHGEVRGALIDLAQLEHNPSHASRSESAARAPAGALPDGSSLTVAVLAGASARPEWIFNVAGRRLAFVAQGVDPSDMHALEEAGWRCLAYRDTSDLAASWADLIAVRQHG